MNNKKNTIIKSVIYIFLILLVVVYLFPLFWIAMNSLKGKQEFTDAPFAKPKALDMEDFKQAGDRVDFAKDFKKEAEKKVASAKKEGVSEIDVYKELIGGYVADSPKDAYLYYEMFKAAASSSLEKEGKAELYQYICSTLTTTSGEGKQKESFYESLLKLIANGSIKGAAKADIVDELDPVITAAGYYSRFYESMNEVRDLATKKGKTPSLRKEAWQSTRLSKILEENIKGAWVDAKLARSLKNSAIVCFITLVLSLLVGSMAAFAIGRMRWKLSTAAMTYFLLGMMIPVHCVLIPLYCRFSDMNLTSSLFSVIIPYTTFALPITIYIMVGFFKSIPTELFEAACIDGCTIYRSFVTVSLPLAKTGLFVTGLMTFVGNWNELLLATVFLSEKNELRTLPMALTVFSGPHSSNIPKSFAAIMVAILPNIVVYCMFSNQIVEGLTVGAVKG